MKRFHPVFLSIVVLILVLAGSGSSALAQEPAAPLPGTMPLNVRGMAADELFKLLATEGGLNIAVGAGVAGQVTIYAKAAPVEQLLDLVVDLIGAAQYQRDGIIRVVTRDEYLRIFGDRYQDRTVRKWIALDHIPSATIAPTVRALLTPQGTLIEDTMRNALLVIDTPENLTDLTEIIRLADQPSTNLHVPLAHANPGTLVEAVRPFVPPAVQLKANPNTKSIVLRGSEKDVEVARGVIERFDQPTTLQTLRFHLSHTGVDSLLGLIEPALTPGVGLVTRGTSNRQFFVSDFPEVLDEIEARVAVLDVPRRQVLIEAKIIRLNLNKGLDVGVNWAAIQEDLNVSGQFGALAPGDDGVVAQYGNLISKDFEIVAEAVESFGHAELLASPRIVVPDGGTGNIHVGSDFPYITTDTRETPAGTVDRFEKVTNVQTGVRLDVSARIHLDDTVTMAVRPEVSSVIAFNEGIPVLETSTAESELSVPNGKTVIFGGLNRNEIHQDRVGVPILMHIPLLKYLFSSTRDEITHSELVILMRPQILTGDEPIEDWTSEEAQRVLEDEQ